MPAPTPQSLDSGSIPFDPIAFEMQVQELASSIHNPNYDLPRIKQDKLAGEIADLFSIFRKDALSYFTQDKPPIADTLGDTFTGKIDLSVPYEI